MKTRKYVLNWMICLISAFVLNGCEDYYSVNVSPAPGEKPVVTLSPEEKLTFSAEEMRADIEIITNMPDSTISFAVNSADTSWCKASLNGRNVHVEVSANPKYMARSTMLTIKVFSVLKTVEIVQDAKEFISEPIYPITGTYKITIPSLDDFSKSKIYKVMDGEQKIAEICLEYLNSEMISSRAVVVYVGQGGAADYKNGYVAFLVNKDGEISNNPENGGKVIFDYENNTLDYLAGTTESATTVYLSTYGITKEEQENAVEITPEPYRVKDISGNSYPVVKVGCEVWLGSNLYTTKFGDGTEIPLIVDTDIPDYGVNKPFATYPLRKQDVDETVYGYLYNSKVVTGENEALIGSSIVDGNWRLSTGGGTNAAGLNGTTTDWQRLFKYIGNNQMGAILSLGYQWNNGGNGAFDILTLSNLTGLSIVAAGELYNVSSSSFFVIGGGTQAFFFYGNGARGYNLAEKDGKAADQAGIREWTHVNDACSIRLVRIDQR